VDRLARLGVESSDRITVATVEGEIDLSNATALEMAISDSVPNEALGLIVDIADVSYLDSAGVGLLFNLARRLSRRQQRFAVVTPKDAPVREVLVLSGATQALPLCDSREEAGRVLQDNASAPDLRPAE
jgi:anti-anti-sigma factor